MKEYQEAIKTYSPDQKQAEKKIWESAFFNFSNLLIKKGCVQAQASSMGNRWNYFRSDQFFSCVFRYKEEFQKILKSLPIDITLKKEQDIHNFIKQMAEFRIFQIFERTPEELKQAKKKKFPQELNLAKEYTPEGKQFITITLVPKKKSSHAYAIAFVLLVLALSLFRIWPFALKLAVFYCSVIILYVSVGVIVARILLYLILRLVGFEFWILPMVFAEVGFIESFRPLFSIEYVKDPWWGIIFRIFAMIVLGLLVYYFIQEPDIISEYGKFGKDSFGDIIDWGSNWLNDTKSNATIIYGNQYKYTQDDDIDNDKQKMNVFK